VRKRSTGGLAAIAGRHPVRLDHRLLDQERIAQRHRGREQRALDALALSGRLARHQRHHGAEGAMQRGREIDPGHLRAIGLMRFPGHIDRAGHDLADAVESDAIGIGAAAAVRRRRGQDDIGLDGSERLVVEPHRGERLRRQVRHHDIRGLHQLSHDLPSLGPHRVERHAALVAVHLQEQGAFAGRGDRRLEPILAALALLDADHLGAVLGHERRAIGPGDIAAEVEHPYAIEHASHPLAPFCPFAPADAAADRSNSTIAGHGPDVKIGRAGATEV